jgi:hypothetical protein
MPSSLHVFTAIFIVGILLRFLAVPTKTHAEWLTTFVYSISLQFLRGPSDREMGNPPCGGANGRAGARIGDSMIASGCWEWNEPS